MDSFDRHLRAAQGFLELGLPLDANEELEDMEPEQRTDLRVVAVRVEVYRALQHWGLMEVCAQVLCRAKPDAVQTWLNLAYATRRAFSLERASGVLMNAVQRFPDEPTIHYNLACYEAQLGNFDSARERLAEAIRREPACRRLALGDPDLAALHGEMT